MKLINIIITINLFLAKSFNLDIKTPVNNQKKVNSYSIDKTVKYLTDINYGNASYINYLYANRYIDTLMHPNMNVLDTILRSTSSRIICKNLEQDSRKVLFLLHHNKYTEEQIATLLKLNVKQINTILYCSHYQILIDLKMQILNNMSL
jgi:hypothetical protein